MEDDEWVDLGVYSFKIKVDNFRIFPKNVKTGKTIVIWVKRSFLHLRHNASLEEMSFKFYKHRRNYYWKKEGVERSSKCVERKNVATFSERKSISRKRIVAMVSRMCFEGSKPIADRLLTVVESRIK